jgi:L-threonylcarbamoyladenylate synthase
VLEPTDDLDRAVWAIRHGGLVAIPTETVYGLAADATDDAAVGRVFRVKGRPDDHPLIVHLAAVDDVEAWSSGVPGDARRLVDAAWPGPLTIIVPRAPKVSDVVTGGRDSVGLRVPAHALTLELIRQTKAGLAAPSANRFGGVSPTTAWHVAADLDGFLDPTRDVILDGGPCPVGVESTIVDFTVNPPQILRDGGIPPEHITALLDRELAPMSGPARASGMLESHYAPTCPVVLVDSADDADELLLVTPGARIIDHGDDLVAAARSLYAELREADANGATAVIAVMPAALGLGHAIRDRLTKAASPRPPSPTPP